jgi:lipopolysaccharide transport system permease protein
MRSLVRNRGLLFSMASRDIAQKYRSSTLGAFWVIGQPILQMLLYSFVFEVVLRSKWGLKAPSGAEVPFGLMLFIGLLLFGILAETLVRSPTLLPSNSSYVQKVIFPLEILPVVTVISSLVSFGFGFLIVVIACLFYGVGFHFGAVLVVFPLFALLVMTLGLGWLFSALGVFFRDLGQVSPSLATILMFTSPVCYPSTMVPAEFRWLLGINPLTIPIETFRDFLLRGESSQLAALAWYWLVALLVAGFGYFVFHRTRSGFADAL